MKSNGYSLVGELVTSNFYRKKDGFTKIRVPKKGISSRGYQAAITLGPINMEAIISVAIGNFPTANLSGGNLVRGIFWGQCSGR